MLGQMNLGNWKGPILELRATEGGQHAKGIEFGHQHQKGYLKNNKNNNKFHLRQSTADMSHDAKQVCAISWKPASLLWLMVWNSAVLYQFLIADTYFFKLFFYKEQFFCCFKEAQVKYLIIYPIWKQKVHLGRTGSATISTGSLCQQLYWQCPITGRLLRVPSLRSHFKRHITITITLLSSQRGVGRKGDAFGD